eukprot:SAG31_NODE_16267_length_716_cov_0.823339_1_plen_30_part_10
MPPNEQEGDTPATSRARRAAIYGMLSTYIL